MAHERIGAAGNELRVGPAGGRWRPVAANRRSGVKRQNDAESRDDGTGDCHWDAFELSILESAKLRRASYQCDCDSHGHEYSEAHSHPRPDRAPIQALHAKRRNGPINYEEHPKADDPQMAGGEDHSHSIVPGGFDV